MPGISRRRFLRDASLGAAAVGTVAVVGALGLRRCHRFERGCLPARVPNGTW